jgi:hypothetical protein
MLPGGSSGRPIGDFRTLQAGSDGLDRLQEVTSNVGESAGESYSDEPPGTIFTTSMGRCPVAQQACPKPRAPPNASEVAQRGMLDRHASGTWRPRAPRHRVHVGRLRPTAKIKKMMARSERSSLPVPSLDLPQPESLQAAEGVEPDRTMRRAHATAGPASCLGTNRPKPAPTRIGSVASAR